MQREYPNRLVPEGATRDLAALLAGNQRGRSVLSGQRYEVGSAPPGPRCDAVASSRVLHFPQRPDLLSAQLRLFRAVLTLRALHARRRRKISVAP